MTRNDVVSPGRGRYHDFHHGIGEGDPDYKLVFQSKHMSVMHRLRHNLVSPFSGNNVNDMYPLGVLQRTPYYE